LARALIVERAILLLDEPFGALDRQLREDLQIEVRALLRRLDITTVFVTHDQDEALSMSDRVAVMNGGRIEQIASPRSLYDTPATKNVAAFIGKGTFISGMIIKDASLSIVRTSIGDFSLPLDAGQPLPEREIDYFLRPEAIHLATSNDGLPNHVTGTVAATTFLGDRQQILVDVQDRVRFLVRLEKVQTPAIGDRISLGWSENSSALFREGQRL
jgi:ABC-type Fe3+/spermidine/putrescine transport system ATPase subunit